MKEGSAYKTPFAVKDNLICMKFGGEKWVYGMSGMTAAVPKSFAHKGGGSASERKADHGD